MLRHKHVRLARLFSNSTAGKSLSEVVPYFEGRLEQKVEAFSTEALKGSDLIFLALPSGEALSLVPQIREQGIPVIDLGGDFRLKDTAQYKKYYKREHSATEFLPSAVYGLPEWNSDRIRNADLISNPGCYPTGATLPLLPLLKEGIIEANGIVINSLSGVSGAGRNGSLEISFSEVNESARAYKVGVHQHIPEIESALTAFSGAPVSLSFIPHLIPITRGIFTTTHATLTGTFSDAEISFVFRKYYGSSPFVRVSASALPEIKNVTGTNYIDIGFRILPGTNQIVLLSAIDNLVKGAAGQAVQNMNVRFGFEETEGILI